MNVVDSSAWLEYFIDGPQADHFAAVIEDTDNLLVPAICIYEVLRRLAALGLGAHVEMARGLMQRGQVIDLDAERAASAALIGQRHQLPMADAVIYAIAREHAAPLWTMDADFERLPGVKHHPHAARSRR